MIDKYFCFKVHGQPDDAKVLHVPGGDCDSYVHGFQNAKQWAFEEAERRKCVIEVIGDNSDAVEFIADPTKRYGVYNANLLEDDINGMYDDAIDLFGDLDDAKHHAYNLANIEEVDAGIYDFARGKVVCEAHALEVRMLEEDGLLLDDFVDALGVDKVIKLLCLAQWTLNATHPGEYMHQVKFNPEQVDEMTEIVNRLFADDRESFVIN